MGGLGRGGVPVGAAGGGGGAGALGGGDGGIRADPSGAGGPDRADAGGRASAADIAGLRRAYGLDLPLRVQYGRYWAGIARGDLGRSLRLHDSVVHLVAQRYPYTLALAGAALGLGALLAVPAGVASARRAGGWVDRALGVGSLAGLSFPNFALGPILMWCLPLAWDGFR